MSAGPASSAAVRHLPEIPPKPLRSKRIDSATQILRIPALRDRVLPGPVEFNEMLQSPTIDRVPVEDHHVTALRERCAVHLTDHNQKPLEFSKDMMHEAIDLVGKENAFHPVAEYLESLRWDGVPRIPRILSEILHAPETAINQRLVFCWMISAVARVLEPGCKADGVLILQGAQGAGKSTFFSVLGGEWFSDSPIDMGRHGDAALACSRAWILELAELASIRRSDVETVKGFITSTRDDFRPPYGRRMISLPRRCVFGGSANPREILVDPTGNRRFWVLPVGEEIAIDLLRIWRDQLWAEAVAHYHNGETWHLDWHDQHLLAQAQEEFEAEDAWTGPVLGFLTSRLTGEPPTTADVIETAVEKPRGQITRTDEMRVARILRAAGYDNPRRWYGSKRERRWVRD